MSDLMLHSVLNMPLPDEPTDCDLVTWVQLKERARQASTHIGELEAKLSKAVEALIKITNKPSEMIWGEGREVRKTMDEMEEVAMNTLAELKETQMKVKK